MGTVTQAGGDVCLFAQYEPDGRLSPTTRHLLGAIAGCGFALQVAFAGVAEVDAQDAAFVASIGGVAHPVANAGLDFGAWGHLLRAGCAAGAGSVLLANDSVFGPFGDVRAIVARMRAGGLDAWAMVQSDERVAHLQSWFLWLSARAMAAPGVQRVLGQDFAAMDKEEVILHGELGLSAALRAAGLRVGSVWPERRGWRRLVPVNPSHFDWHGMLRGGAVPFIKRELLRDNPVNLWWLAGWRRMVPDAAGIEAALAARTGRAGPFPPLAGGRRLHRVILNTLLTRDTAAALAGLVRGLHG